MFPPNWGLLQIQSDGKCVYSSDTVVTSPSETGSPTNQPGMYTMSHVEKVVCNVTDPEGNNFQVSSGSVYSKFQKCVRMSKKKKKKTKFTGEMLMEKK